MKIKNDFKDDNTPFISWYYLNYKNKQYNFQVGKKERIYFNRANYNFITFLKKIINANKKRVSS